MSDLQSPSWYSAEYNSNPEASNPFGIEALRLTPNAEMHAFLAAGGRLTDWLKMKEAKNAA